MGCAFKGDPEPTVTWMLKGREIKTDKRYKITFDKESDSSILEIEKCKESDEGTYQVTIKNIHGSETAPVTLMVTEKAEDVQDYKALLKITEQERKTVEEETPDWGKLKATPALIKDKDDDPDKIKLRKVELLPIFIKDPVDLKVMREKEANFECTIKSTTNLNVSWIINEKELTIKDGVRFDKDLAQNRYSLQILRANESKVGAIKVLATNEHGSAERICRLSLLGNFQEIRLNEKTRSGWLNKCLLTSHCRNAKVCW